MTPTLAASGSTGKRSVREILDSVPRSNTEPEAEQEALYSELQQAISDYIEPLYVDIMRSRTKLTHDMYSDSRELFRVYISALPSGVSMAFIKVVHDILEVNDVEHPESIVDEHTILAAEKIHLATSTIARTGSNNFADMSELTRDMIHYALVSGDSDTVAAIIKERHPSSVEELRAIHAESRSVESALQRGVL